MTYSYGQNGVGTIINYKKFKLCIFYHRGTVNFNRKDSNDHFKLSSVKIKENTLNRQVQETDEVDNSNITKRIFTFIR